MKKILTILLVLALCLSLAPLCALAESEGMEEYTEAISEYTEEPAESAEEFADAPAEIFTEVPAAEDIPVEVPDAEEPPAEEPAPAGEPASVEDPDAPEPAPGEAYTEAAVPGEEALALPPEETAADLKISLASEEAPEESCAEAPLAAGGTIVASGTCGKNGNNLTWTLDNAGTLTISGKGEMGNYFSYYIPWDTNKNDIKTVVIEAGVTGIGGYAFWNCTSLTSITIPKGVTSIGEHAFYNCTSLTSITIPEGVTSIGEHAFYNCTSLTSITIPEGVTSIGDCAFSYCTGLTQVTIPEGVTSIGKFAFDGCTSLTSITIPKSVTSIGYEAFNGCTGLTSIIIPDGVTSIGNKAFRNCVSLTQVTISEGVTSIGEGAFYYCQSLTQVTIPKSVTSIGESAFYRCDSLQTLNYAGTSDEWEKISIADGNQVLFVAYALSNDLNKTIITDNLSDNNYRVRAQPVNSYLYENPDGSVTRVENIGSFVLIESWSSAGVFQNGRAIACELPIFGGFFAGTDYNYLVFGQRNQDEDDKTEIMRVVKYSKNWERLDSVSVYGANTVRPFDAGSLRMDEGNGLLYIHTCHVMYKSSDGLNHQANMTYVLDESTMRFTDSRYLVTWGWGYVSHSFNQFVRTDGSYVYRVDHGDAYPRAVCVTRAPISKSITNVISIDILNISGNTGDNSTGVSVGGFETGGSKLLVAGNSVDMQNYDPNGTRNIFLSVTEKDLSSTKLIWLTNHAASSGITVRTPQLVKINESRFLVLWEEYDASSSRVTLYAVVVNQNGEALREPVSLSGMRLSDCQPIVTSDGMVTWYVTNGKSLSFYTCTVSGEKQDEVAPVLPHIPGDANGDNTVDGRDLIRMKRYIAGYTDAEIYFANADVTGDGIFDGRDVVRLARYLAGYDVALG